MRRRKLPFGAGLALLCAWAPPLAAQPAATAPSAAPAARLRLALERNARRLEVGEAIVVRLEVWVTSWFQAPVDFPSTLVAEGALVEAVGGSPDSRFEQFGGRRWTGLVRRYRVLPAQPGELALTLADPLSVQPGGGTRPQRLAPPPPLRLSVWLPAGAEDIQPFVAARRLELRQRWWPDETAAAGTAPLQVGDLVRREVVLVTDSTSPLLPAPDFAAPPGVAVRVQAAEAQERRGNAAATPKLTRRVEAVYTLQRVGAVALPPIELVWWDLAGRQRRVTRIPGRTLAVQPALARADPFAIASPASTVASPPASAAQRGPASGRGAVAALVAGGLMMAGAVLWGRRAAAGGSAPRAPRSSPARTWRRLQRACRRDDAATADAAVHEALALLEPDVRRRWLQDGDLAAALTDLGRLRFGRPGATSAAAGGVRWQGQALWQAVSRLRHAARATGVGPALPALHP